MNDCYLHAAVRTPFGRFGGALSTLRPDDLSAHVLNALLASAPDLQAGQVDEVEDYVAEQGRRGEEARARHEAEHPLEPGLRAQISSSISAADRITRLASA